MQGFVKKFKEMWFPAEDYEEEYEDDCEQDKDNTESGNTSGKSKENCSHNNRVVNIHTTAKLQVVLFKPERFGDETRNIADELLKMHTIVLNLEQTSKEASRRIIDFLSGIAYANGGKIKKVATETFIVTPYNVDITGDDIMDELENNGVCF
jgi:cell division inhibitor SepF